MDDICVDIVVATVSGVEPMWYHLYTAKVNPEKAMNLYRPKTKVDPKQGEIPCISTQSQAALLCIVDHVNNSETIVIC